MKKLRDLESWKTLVWAGPIPPGGNYKLPQGGEVGTLLNVRKDEDGPFTLLLTREYNQESQNGTMRMVKAEKHLFDAVYTLLHHNVDQPISQIAECEVSGT